MIRKAATHDAPQRLPGALAVVNAIGDAVVVAELELGNVAVKVLLATVLIDTLHPALEDAEIPFHRVAVDTVCRPDRRTRRECAGSYGGMRNGGAYAGIGQRRR